MFRAADKPAVKRDHSGAGGVVRRPASYGEGLRTMFQLGCLAG